MTAFTACKKLLENALQAWHTVHCQGIWLLQLFTTNILWVVPLRLQGSGIGDILRSCHSVAFAHLRLPCSTALSLSPGRIGCATKIFRGSVTLMTGHSASSTCLSGYPRATAKQRWQLSPQWEAGRAAMCQLGINVPPLQFGVNKLSKQMHAADDVSALCLSITNGLSAHWFPPYISQESRALQWWHPVLVKSVPPVRHPSHRKVSESVCAE